ncbi:uncharacterized protein LOC143440362 isoform X1 [Arvicanthis niloticus]|uniref:uncharacterized protein LOC117700494 isoform X1 n=1 Tax=Arvicanthis niloticus TaxID=61156 RepID=UPI00402B2AD7
MLLGPDLPRPRQRRLKEPVCVLWPRSAVTGSCPLPGSSISVRLNLGPALPVADKSNETSKKHKMNRLFNQTKTEARSPLRGSTQKLTQTDTDTHSQTVDGAWGLLWKNRRKDCSPERNRNSTGRPTESANLDPWGSQRLNHQ